MVEVGNIALKIMKQCETISTIVCNASYLKVDCYQFRNDPIRRIYCVLCNIFDVEDARHIILHCPALNMIRDEMFQEILRF